MNIYERLQQDHAIQRELARRLSRTTGDSPDRRHLWAAWKLEMESHADAEEQTLYASLMATLPGQDAARYSIAEHKDAAVLLGDRATVLL